MEVLAPETTPRAEVVGTLRHRFFWRVHFWAGAITAPILIFAAVTGLIYVFNPQIEAWKHRDLDVVAVPGDGGTRRALDEQAAAAQRGNEGLSIRSILPALHAQDTTRVVFGERRGRQRGETAAKATNGPDDEHAQHRAAPPEKMASAKPASDHGHGLPDGRIAYVNPYTGTLIGTHGEMDRFATWAKKLHSTALQGDGWRWVLELGASWMLVMLATGIYLFWPKPVASGGGGWRALIPRRRDSGVHGNRLVWRDWHAIIGIAMSLMLAAILVTGLTWSKYAGDNFRTVQGALGQSSPRAPPALTSTPGEGVVALPMQAIHNIARRAAPDVQLLLTPPQGREGVWRVASADSSQPGKRAQMVIDPYSGALLYQSGWDAMPVLAKATSVGIPFHRGEFGIWNQALLVLAALTTLFSMASGFVMWWKRRPRGKLAAPQTTGRHIGTLPKWLWLVASAMAFALPVFGVSLAVFIAVEAMALWIGQRQRNLAQPA